MTRNNNQKKPKPEPKRVWVVVFMNDIITCIVPENVAVEAFEEHALFVYGLRDQWKIRYGSYAGAIDPDVYTVVSVKLLREEDDDEKEEEEKEADCAKCTKRIPDCLDDAVLSFDCGCWMCTDCHERAVLCSKCGDVGCPAHHSHFCVGPAASI